MRRFFSLASVLVLAAGMSAAQTSNASAAQKHSKPVPTANDAARQTTQQTPSSDDATSAPSSTASQPADAAASPDAKAPTAAGDTPRDTVRDSGASDNSATRNRAGSNGNGSNWGWIGLFGLLGLLPRGNKNRAVTPMRTSSGDTGRERIRRVG